MEFIKRMKKREFLEMGLKTAAALLAAFLAIILMEGMIYSIQLHALRTGSGNYAANNSSTIAYCIEDKDDKYIVLYYNEGQEYQWSSSGENNLKTREECTPTGLTVKEVIFDAPNAFQFSITGVHSIIIGLFVAVVAGFFTYRFIRLAKLYKGIEDEFVKTGTIAFNN